MRRKDRLFEIMKLLQDGGLHKAEDMATRLGVSHRTIYRDMETLASSGVPVSGARGRGYRTTRETALPQLSLTEEELGALTLGIAIVSETADPDLRRAALALAAKVDAALPEQGIAAADAWKFETHPFADTARGVAHIPVIRAAIRGRQKLKLTCVETDGRVSRHVVRPLQVEYWGRVWALTSWCEIDDGFVQLRLDSIETLTPLPELFGDEPGRMLADFRTHKAG